MNDCQGQGRFFAKARVSRCILAVDVNADDELWSLCCMNDENYSESFLLTSTAFVAIKLCILIL